MEAIVVLIVLAVVGYFFMRSGTNNRSTPSGQTGAGASRSSPRPKSLFEANEEWLRERWKMAAAEQASGDIKHFPKWYFDAPSERQLERLEAEGVSLGGKPSKGQVSDVIGLHEEPDEYDLERLKFHKITLTGALKNQTRARHEVALLDRDPEKVREWENRPADAYQKEFFRFAGIKIPAGLSHAAAVSMISEKLDAMPEEQQAKWEAYEEMLKEFDDPDFRAEAEIRKPSLSDLRDAFDTVYEKTPEPERNSIDPHEVADLLKTRKPSLFKESRE